jgi:protein-disulfide isomerase/uncharacterized membrane protein
MIIAALISSLASVGIHLYLTIQHFQLKLGLADGHSFCNINSTFNCDTVAVSPFAVLFGIPIATWGATTNLMLAVLLLTNLTRLSENPPRILRLAFWLSFFVVVVSLVMGAISSLILKTYCLNCMAAYFLSFLTVFFIWRAMEENPFSSLGADLASLFGDHRWVLLVFAAIPAGSFLGNAIVGDSYGISKLKIVTEESRINWQNASSQPFDLTKGLSLQKGKDAPVMTIVEFADFKCPHCRMAYPTLHTFAEGRPDVRLIYKSFPLDGVCNPDMPRKGDGATCQLAYSVFCAEKLNQKGWEFHNWIFDHQEGFLSASSPETLLKEAASEKQIDFSELQKCMNSSEISDLVAAQAKEGADAKIGGTPSIFVNGKLLERGQFMPVLESVYNLIKGRAY